MRVRDHAGEEVARRPRSRGDDNGLARRGGALDVDDPADAALVAVDLLQLIELDRGDDAEIHARPAQPFGCAGREDPAQHVALTHWVKFGGPGSDHHVVGVHVKHLPVGQTNDDERARIHPDDVVAELARQNQNLSPLGSCAGGCGSS